MHVSTRHLGRHPGLRLLARLRVLLHWHQRREGPARPRPDWPRPTPPACACAGGETLREAIENVGLCMFNYMTPLKGIGVDPALTR